MALRPGSKTRARVRVVSDGQERRRGDYLATEEPLEIRLLAGGATERLAVTMRTPGNDFELAAGFLHGEGIYGLPDKLREAQGLFESTGGLHAAGLFTPEGELECLREDVGRHNAVDKLVGWALLEGRLPLADRILLVSGRASFEIMQKALAAGVPMVCAVSAPSSLAVDVAERFGMTLAGFLRGRRFNLYTGPDRVLLPTPAEHSS